MRRRSLAPLASGSILSLLAACGGDPNGTVSPTMAPGTTPSRSISQSCNFTTVRADANAYFTSPNDAVFTLITNLAQLSGTEPATTAKVMDILTEVAQTRFSSAVTSADAGGTFVNDLLACSVLTVPATFNAASSLRSGIFEVRAPGQVASAALASIGLNTPANPEWGVEPNPSPALPGLPTWPNLSTAAPRYLIFGYLVSNANLLNEHPATFDPGANGFELRTIPNSITPDKTAFTVGACIKANSVDANGNPAANRLIHSAILVNLSPKFCAVTSTSASLSRSSWLSVLGRRAASFFVPRTASAQADGDFFSGGGPSTWSPFGAVQILGSSIGAKFSLPPTDQNINTAFSHNVAVTANTAAGNLLQGVSISLQISGNSGAPSHFCVSPTAHETCASTPDIVTAVTDANGVATFTNLGVTKAGGFTLTATGSFGLILTGSARSAMFHIKNK